MTEKSSRAESVAEALGQGPQEARRALARRLAAIIDDPESPAYAIVSAARALGVLLTEIETADAEPEQSGIDVDGILGFVRQN